MSGNIGEKARAAFLALIMVTSVMAAGVALTGSAAATSVDKPGTITATPADQDGVSSTHVITLPVNDILDGNDLTAGDPITVEYDNTNLDPADIDAVADAQVEYVAQDGSVTDLLADGDDSVVSVSNDASTVTINLGDDNAPVTANAGGYVRIVIGGTDQVSHTSAPETNDVTVTVDAGDDGADIDETLTLGLGPQAPIQLDDTDDGEYHYSLQQALNDDTGSTQTVTISGTLDEFASQPVSAASLSAAQHDHDDTIIQGNNNTFEITDTDGVDLNEQDNITYQDLNFNASDVVTDNNGNSIQAIATSASASNEVTISGNTFTNFTGTNVIDVGTGGSVNNLTITDNTVDVGDTNGIVVDANLDSDSNQFLDVSNNEVTTTSGNNGLDLTVADAGASANDDVTISSNDIADDGSDGGNGITLAGDYSLDIEDGSVDNVQTGLNLGTGSQEAINVTGVTLTNITDAASSPVGVDATGDLPTDAAVTIDGLAVDSSSGATAVAVDDDIDLRVVDSTIADVSEAVDVTSAKAVTVTNTTITGASGDQAVHIDQPGASASITIDGKTSIDQTDGDAIEVDLGDTVNGQSVTIDDVTLNGSTGAGVQVVDLDDDGGTSATVDITKSTLSDNGIGLDVDDATKAGATLRAHFNTFDANTNGVDVADLNVGSFEVNVTFNDYRNSGEDGVVVASQSNSDTVNAKYSYWDSDAGPNSDLGDSVTAAAGDATTEPFLLESAVDNYDDSNLGGTNVLRFGHNVEVTNNKGSLAFPAVANRTAGEAIEGDTTNVMIYKLVDGAFVDAGDQVPQTMEGHVVDLTEANNDSAFVTITYSDDVADSSGGYTYEQGANLVGAPKQGDAGLDAVFNLRDEYVISPYLDNTGNFYPGDYARTTSISDDTGDLLTAGDLNAEVSPFSAYVIEVPDNETRFKGGYIPGGTDASEIDGLLSNGGA